MPCKHIMTCMTQNNLDTIEFVETILEKSSYLLTYSYNIHPLPNLVTWPRIDIVQLKHPISHAKADKPKDNRI